MKKKDMIKVMALPASAYIAFAASGAIVQAAEVETNPEDIAIPVETAVASTEATDTTTEATDTTTEATDAKTEATDAKTEATDAKTEATETAQAKEEGASVAKATSESQDKVEEKVDYREQFHFSNEANWSNDPNGLVFYNGEWHLFFQYNPTSVNHGPMNWGHATSKDLVHWTEHEIPEVFKADAYKGEGTRRHFSGSIVHDVNNTSGFFNNEENGGLVAIWTVSGRPGNSRSGFGSQRQAIAYSLDGFNWIEPDLNIDRVLIDSEGNARDLTDGEKDYFKNVVLAENAVQRRTDSSQSGEVKYESDDPLADGAFRDPKVFWHKESNQWIMAVAGGPLRFYSSKDLKNWKAEAMQPEITTECPELYYLPIQGTNEHKYVLSEGGRWYQIGDFKEVDGKLTFVPENGADGTPARFEMNYAPDAYAAQSFYNAEGGRVIMIQWMSNWSYAGNTSKTELGLGEGVLGGKHNGQFTLPAELYLVNTPYGLRMAQKPVEEFDSMKNAEFEFKDITLDSSSNPLKDLNSQQFQMEIEFTPEKGTNEVVLELLKNSKYETTLRYNVQTQTLSVDRSNSMSADKAPADHKQNGTWWKFLAEYSAPVPMKDGKVKLHIFVDNYSIEVYGNDYTSVLTMLVFPEKDATSMNLYATGTPLKANVSFATMDSYRNANVDMRDLSSRLEELKTMTVENKGFTKDTYDLFTKTYNDAVKAIFSPDSTQNSINTALAALNKAYKGLALDLVIPEQPEAKPGDKPAGTPADQAKAEEAAKEEAKPMSTVITTTTKAKTSPQTGVEGSATFMSQLVGAAGMVIGLGVLKKRRSKGKK